MEAKSCAGLGEAGAGTSPFPEPLHNPCRGWRNLQISGFSHFFANARFQYRRSFAGHIAAPTDQTVGEGLESAHF
jgi:hypothetical protein